MPIKRSITTNDQIKNKNKEGAGVNTKQKQKEEIKNIPIEKDSELGDGIKNITDYRRKGVLRSRRLSRISLGKQLALSETSGLRLQWIVDN
jgi:aspartyl-tRNA synthetase